MSVTFADLARVATDLSEGGELVCQIHFTGTEAPDAWSWRDYGTHLIKGAATNMVVVTDGRKFGPDGRQIAQEASE